MKRYARLSLLSLVALCAAMSISSDALAYSRSPSGSPADEPITFDVDEGTDASSNCVGGYQTIGIQTEAGSPYSTGYLDWLPDAATNTWENKTCDDIAYWQGNAEDCTDDFPVVEVTMICNANAAYDESWSAYSLDATDWEWAIAEGTTTTTSTTETTTSTTTTISDPNRDIFFGVLLFIASMVIAYAIFI